MVMKRIWLIAIAFISILSICNGQTQKKDVRPVRQNEPKTSIKVNKEYDKQGNLIRYDSTAVYSFSNINGNNNDFIESFFRRSDSLFNARSPFFDELFNKDTLFRNEFFNMGSMESIMNKMDSIHNAFFKRQLPLKASKKK